MLDENSKLFAHPLGRSNISSLSALIHDFPLRPPVPNPDVIFLTQPHAILVNKPLAVPKRPTIRHCRGVHVPVHSNDIANILLVHCEQDEVALVHPRRHFCSRLDAAFRSSDADVLRPSTVT